MRKKDPYQRLVLDMEDEIGTGRYTLADLTAMMSNKDNAAITVDGYYDSVSVSLTWTEPESEEAWKERISRHEAAQAREQARIAKKVAKHREKLAKEELKKQALAKLTDDERKALGF